MGEILGIFMSRADGPAARQSEVAGKFDPAVCDFAWNLPYTTSTGMSIPFAHKEATGNVTWYHFAWQQDNQSTSVDGWTHTIRDATGLGILLIDFIDGKIRLNVTGSTTGYSGTQIGPGSLTRVDIRVEMDTGTDVKLYMDGGRYPFLHGSVADKGTRGKPAQLVYQNWDSAAMWMSETYVADFDTRGTRMVKQLVDAVGTHTDWAGGYSELGDENMATGADGAAAGDKVSVNVEAYPGPASLGGINRVLAKVTGSRGAAGPQKIDPFVRIASTDYSAGDIGPVEVPLAYIAEWAINPNTGAEWGTAALDTTEFGLEAKT